MIIRALEYIVSSTHIGEVAICVPLRNISRSIVAARHALPAAFRVIHITSHQAQREWIQSD